MRRVFFHYATRQFYLKSLVLSMCSLLAILSWKNRYDALHERSPRGLLDLPNFRLMLNSNACSNDTFMLIFIHSAPGHFRNRQTIRQTWGSPSSDLPRIKTLFMLAVPNNKTLQSLLQRESEIHGDIVQGNFMDSYRNLTYKHIMGMQWVVNNCSQAQFVLKMDDDIFVDIYQLVNLLQSKFSDLGTRIACYHHRNMLVIRDPVSKWYVAKEEYSANTYIDYCSGWAYVTTTRTAKLLVETVSQLPFFWVDDVYITGIAAKKAGISIVDINEYFTMETEDLAEWVRSKEYIAWNKIFSTTWSDQDLTLMAHNKAKSCYYNKCKCCYVKTTPKPKKLTTESPATGKSLIEQLA